MGDQLFTFTVPAFRTQGGEVTGKWKSVRKALTDFQRVLDVKNAFIEANRSDGEPECGYSDWDEAMESYNYDLAELGERLTDALSPALAGTVKRAAEAIEAYDAYMDFEGDEIENEDLRWRFIDLAEALLAEIADVKSVDERRRERDESETGTPA